MTETPPLATLDFLTHSKIRIAADPSSIWPTIIELKGGSGQQLVHIGGEPGQVGERFHAVDSAAPDVPFYVVENVELYEGQRRTIRLDSLDGAFMGFATWELTPAGEDTIVAYDVYCRYPGLPPGQSAQEYMAGFQRVMDEGMQRLKSTVEEKGA